MQDETKPEQPDERTEWQIEEDEEAERLNRMAEAARKMGIVIPTGCGGEAPELNPDGSLKTNH